MTTPDVAPARGPRTLYLIAFICFAPAIAAYVAYFYFPRDRQTNYGQLVAIQPAPVVAGTTLDGKPFLLTDLKGRWPVIVTAGGACDRICEGELYATRQARTIQGRERERVVRVWLITDNETPSAALLAQHPDLVAVRATKNDGHWPAGQKAIYLVDPIGNQVLAWPAEPDIKALANDITKLLRASQIG
jgi:cytochrome oxidase Cu insertion factor (SCO1/SenC/PrrC family)